MVESWTEKYRPKKLDDVEGNPKAIAELRHWAEDWESKRLKKGDKKAVILAGGPGTGKTSAAHALANDFRWGVVELNASDSRNAAAIKKIATVGAISDTFTSNGDFLRSVEGGEKLIILDEVDNVFGKEDSGGLLAIIDTIERTAQPIVMTANDYYELSRRSGKLRDLAQLIRFSGIKPETVKAVLRKVAVKENIRVDAAVFDYISDHSEGDLRSALNDLQSVAEGKTDVTVDDLKSLSYRDIKKTIFDSLAEIFRTTNAKNARDSIRNLDEEPGFVVLWLDENLPMAYRDLGDMKRGYDALAKADIYLGRAQRKKQFGMWRYANDMMTVGVALAKKRSFGGGGGYQFPSWLRKMGQYRGIRAAMDSLLGKIAGECHTSKSVARREILPYFRHLFCNSKTFRVAMISGLHREGLEEQEIALLLGEPASSHAVRHALEDAAKAAAMNEETEPAKDDDEKDFQEQTGVQSRLF